MGEMFYEEFVELYEEISKTTKRLEKTTILASFLRKLEKQGKSEWIYLLKGKVVPDYDSREIGISRQITIKAVSRSFGIKEEEIEKRFRKIGDLGDITEELAKIKKQRTLFSKKLTVGKVFSNLIKIMEIEGHGAIDKKIGLISELLGSASDKEAKYIVRTLLADLRIGIADGVIRDSIAEAFFQEEKKEMSEKIESAYSLSNDFAKVLEHCAKGKHELEKIDIVPGKPINVMLAVKVADIEEAFEVCNKPAAIEHKYDGFRMLISKHGKEIKLFTRRLENVTNQFPDVVEVVRKNVKGDSFMLDSEVVGFDPKTEVYKPFEAISQRIKRKYEIEKLIKELPVEVNVFDIVYYNGKSLLNLPFRERRKLIEKIVSSVKLKIRVAEQIITDSEKEALDFYKKALKLGEEGIMVKNIEAPYQSGRRVGYMVKLKPSIKDLDLVIVGAEYGSGKRAGWLTSYILACRSEDEFLEIGKVSSGLKELSEEGTSYEEMSDILKPLIKETKDNVVTIKPKVVVSVTYQNIQQSPSYSSGYALRFPRITAYRPDRSVKDIASIEDIEKEVKRTERK
jgi:DNA ligase 1